MVTFKRIVIASLVAPIAITGPLLVLAMLSWALMDPVSDGDAPFRMVGLGMLSAIPLYLVIALLCVVVALSLQRFGALSRRSLLVISTVLAFALAGWIALKWVELGNNSQAAYSFLLFFSVFFLASAALSLAWWRCLSSRSL